MKEISYTALYLFLQFGLLYFSAAYFAGKSVQGLSLSPVWKLVYYYISGIGTLIYRVAEWVFGLVCYPIWQRRHGRVLRAVLLVADVVWIGLVVFALIKIGDYCNSLLFSTSEIELELEDVTQRGTMLNNAMSLIAALRAIHSNESLGWLQALSRTVVVTLEYIVFYIIFYSVIFGVLENKMTELHLASILYDVGGDEDDELYLSFPGLLHSLRSCIVDTMNNIAVMENLLYAPVLVLFIVFMLLLGCIFSLTGHAVQGDTLLAVIIEASGVVDALSTFLLVALFNLALQLITHFIVPKFIPILRGVVKRMSIASRRRHESIQKRRREWYLKHDVAFRVISNAGPVKEMHLD